MPDKSDNIQVLTLRKRPEFLRVAASGNKIVTTSMLIQYALQEDATARFVRVGLTATKRLGGAVVRNRAKRRLRAAIRECMPEVGTPGCDYVFIARKETCEATFEVMRRDMRYALRKIGKLLGNRA